MNNQGKNLFLLLLLVFTGGFLNAAELTLAENGKTQYKIVIPSSVTSGDKLVLKELQTHLRSMTKTEFPSVEKPVMPTSKRIFLGIAPDNFDINALADQEHCVKTSGDDLYLFGKGPNGTRYAVYDFLVNVLGFRFFDARGGTRIPERTFLRIPELDRKQQFSFSVRRTTMYWLFYHPHSTFFLYRNGQNNWVQPVFKSSPLGSIESTSDDLLHLIPLGHTLPKYLPNDEKGTSGFGWIRNLKVNLWKEHPEYFTLNHAGKRIPDHQYCMSNPELRKLLSHRILETMKRNPQCNLFDVSGRDTPGRFCHCANCLALEKKYGCIGGPLFDFLLEFCPVAERQYPGKLISTLVYRKDQTQKPPKSISKFPDNFVPVFAPIDDNFTKNFAHPDNLGTYEDLKRWTQLCKNVFVWYYTNPYGAQITPPFGNLGRFAEDIRLMKKAGVTGIVAEHDVGVAEMSGFTELQSYVGLRLFQDVSQPWETLVDEFFDFEYGKSASLVKQYWTELEELREVTQVKMSWNPTLSAFDYLTPERLMRWTELFDRIEEMMKEDPARLFNIQRLRLNLDLVLLQKYQSVKTAYPALAVSPETLSRRIRERYKYITETLFSVYPSRKTNGNKRMEENLLIAQIQAQGESIPLPREIFGSFQQNQLFVTIPKVHGRNFIKSGDTAFGWCTMHDNPAPSLPFRSDFHDIAGNRYYSAVAAITDKDLGPRGKYKFYKFGSVKLSPDCEFKMGARSWWQFRASLGNAYVPGSFNNAIIYASLKFEGPAFYKEDAGKPNRVFCDRIVVVRLN